MFKNRIDEIDRSIDDVMKKRVFVSVERSLGVEEYVDWLLRRPDNLLRLVDIARHLLIIDLSSALKIEHKQDLDIKALIRVLDFARDAYQKAVEFELEGRRISIPEGFENIHLLQSGWATTIQDGFKQMMLILENISKRSKGDKSPVIGQIIFHEPNNINEFTEELEKLLIHFSSFEE